MKHINWPPDPNLPEDVKQLLFERMIDEAEDCKYNLFRSENKKT